MKTPLLFQMNTEKATDFFDGVMVGLTGFCEAEYRLMTRYEAGMQNPTPDVIELQQTAA